MKCWCSSGGGGAGVADGGPLQCAGPVCERGSAAGGCRRGAVSGLSAARSGGRAPRWHGDVLGGPRRRRVSVAAGGGGRRLGADSRSGGGRLGRGRRPGFGGQRRRSRHGAVAGQRLVAGQSDPQRRFRGGADGVDDRSGDRRLDAGGWGRVANQRFGRRGPTVGARFVSDVAATDVHHSAVAADDFVRRGGAGAGRGPGRCSGCVRGVAAERGGPVAGADVPAGGHVVFQRQSGGRCLARRRASPGTGGT